MPSATSAREMAKTFKECAYNPGVQCERMTCKMYCGWNPDITKLRKQRIRAMRQEERSKRRDKLP